MAYFALIDEAMAALKALEGLTAWNLEPLLEIKQSSRNFNDGPTWVTSNRRGSKQARKEPSPWRTCARHAISCRRMTSFGFWTRNNSHRSIVRKHTLCLLWYRKQGKEDVLFQYENSIDSCLAFTAGPPSSPRTLQAFLEGFHHGQYRTPSSRGKVRAIENLSGDVMTKLADVWYEWRGNGESSPLLQWCQVEDQIVVERVWCSKVGDSSQMHQTALTKFRATGGRKYRCKTCQVCG